MIKIIEPINKNLSRKKIQVKQISVMAMKKTYWLIWNKQIKIPDWVNSKFIDSYFAEFKKAETIIKKEVKQEEKVESIKQKTFLDDKRNQMLSIMLSRFPYSEDDLYKVLVKFDYDVFEQSKINQIILR